jgi:hypothetical protein
MTAELLIPGDLPWFPVLLDATGEHFVPPGIVPFPRGFAFGHDGRLFLASGIGPNGESDPDLSPLDLAIAPNGNVVVSSEHPFGASDAVTSVREYDTTDGHLVRVFSPTKLAEFRKPRGLRFGPDGHLYCVAQDAVVAFDFTKGACLGTPVQFQRLNGQALAFFP